MVNYFIITGFENGEPIEPYVIETYSAYPYINMGLYQDSVRYYEPITEEEYNKLIQKERKENKLWQNKSSWQSMISMI